MIKDVLDAYFEAFSQKDLSRLQTLFAEDVFLEDWTGHAQGIDQVARFNQKLFQQVNCIKIHIIDICYLKNKAMCELEITIDGELISAVDAISFNDDLKIIGISAYKR